MPGFSNDVVYFGGIDTRGVSPIANQMTTDGQLLIGSTAAPHIKVGTITAGSGITVTPSSGSIQISSSGDFTLISTQTATNSASLSWTNLVSGTYFLTYNAIVPADADRTMFMYISTNNGSSYISSDYQSGTNTAVWNSATFVNSNFTGAYLLSAVLDNADPGVSGFLYMGNQTSKYNNIYGECTGFHSGQPARGIFSGWNTNVNVNAIQIAMNAGNIKSGTVSLYYIKT